MMDRDFSLNQTVKVDLKVVVRPAGPPTSKDNRHRGHFIPTNNEMNS